MLQKTGKFVCRNFSRRIGNNSNFFAPATAASALQQSRQSLFLSNQPLVAGLNSLRLYSTEKGNETTESGEETSEEKERTQHEENTEQQENQEEQPEKELSEEEQKIEELSGEVEKFKKAYASCLAEAENVRRIARQDVKNATDFSVSKMAKSMLDVVDNLDRALSVMHPEDLEAFMKYFSEHQDEDLRKKANQMKSIVSGVELTRKVMMKALESNGISQIEDATNGKFDPEFHEALMKQPITEENKDKVGQVAHVINQGYMIKNRILRPAKVVVFVDPDNE